MLGCASAQWSAGFKGGCVQQQVATTIRSIGVGVCCKALTPPQQLAVWGVRLAGPYQDTNSLTSNSPCTAEGPQAADTPLSRLLPPLPCLFSVHCLPQVTGLQAKNNAGWVSPPWQHSRGTGCSSKGLSSCHRRQQQAQKHRGSFGPSRLLRTVLLFFVLTPAVAAAVVVTAGLQ